MENKHIDVFISYSRKDYVDEHKNIIPGNEVSKIIEAFKKAKITYWFDEEGIYSGDRFAEKIARSIKASSIFVFLSTHNSNQSDWTANEISTANMYKKKIIPVRIDDSVYHDSVIMFISRLSHIDYNDNPDLGRKELIRSINSYLAEEKRIETLKKEDELLKKKSIEIQKRLQEKEKERQERIDKMESDLALLEVQRVEFKKIVLQKEQELKMVQVDCDDCELKIKKLQSKICEEKGTLMISPDKKEKAITTSPKNASLSPVGTNKAIGGISVESISEKFLHFSSRAEVFEYVKANSLYPASLSNSFEIKSSINKKYFVKK